MVEFGTFALDADCRHLLRDGVPIHLTPKAFDLLSLLVASAPRVVTKQELHRHLWPRTFVSDATLAGLVKEIRRAIRDCDRAAPLIRTAHRVGYACCVDLAPAQPVARMWHWLVFHDRRVALHAGRNVVGRDPRSDVRLDSSAVSRCHAQITIAGVEAQLEDLGSKNGTRVSGLSLEGGAVLCDGDRVTFGAVAAVYRNSGSGLSTETHSRVQTGESAGSERKTLRASFDKGHVQTGG
jgi:hypothetical protein